MKKRIGITIDLEDPTPERVKRLIDLWMTALDGNVRRSDTPMVLFEDVEDVE